MSDPAKKVTGKKAVAKKTGASGKKAATKKAPGVKATGTESAPAKKAAAVHSSKAETAPASRFFKLATGRAKRMVGDPERLREIAERASRSLAQRSESFVDVLDDFRALIRLVVAYARGLYRQIPLDRLVVVVAGLIYVVSPIDLIPDFLPVGGLLDDAVVISWVIKAVREELDAFREWESGLTD